MPAPSGDATTPVVAPDGDACTATAILAVRNGVAYLDACVRHLLHEGLQVVVVDHGSDDGTRQRLAALQAEGSIGACIDQPWDGRFSLREQLQLKRELARQANTDWILHVDVDELPHSARPGESLRGALARAAAAGANVVNFEEFVFLPLGGRLRAEAGRRFPDLPYYYFFAPAPLRLMRAWKRGLAADNIGSGGHRLEGTGLKVWEEQLVLRHYPFLDQPHAYGKYAARRFDAGELARGWHGNRTAVASARFRFPPAKALQRMADPQDTSLDRSRPRTLHYWQWTNAGRRRWRWWRWWR